MATNYLGITKIHNREMMGVGGVWVTGKWDGMKWEALVFADQPTNKKFAIGKSRISKLWIVNADGDWLYNFDRGVDVPAKTSAAANLQSRITHNLARVIHG